MAQINLLKMTKDTKVFKKGQKVWYSWPQFNTQCNGSVMVIGRYKGRGRYLDYWVRIEPSTHGKPNARLIGLVEVDEIFFHRLRKKADMDEE